MAWQAKLKLDYTRDGEKTIARFAHSGPLRILQSLYPQGDAICHNVLVHPPGGLVGGDTLDITVTAQGDAHGLVTTPGATRFYRSEGELALQRTHIQLRDSARLEWLPMEAICYNGCLAENQLRMDLRDESELIGWDVTALGLPFANQPFERASFCQHIEVPGVWLERGRLDASDVRLLNGPVGLAGNRCMASIFFITAHKMDKTRRQSALDAARAVIDLHPLRATAGAEVTAGATSPNDRVVVVRVLAPVVEPAMQLLKGVWAAWRRELWRQTATVPRIWAT